MDIVDVYTDGYVINYQEGDRSLERLKLLHKEDLDDRSHIIKQGDTLDLISFQYYGNPLYWYIIADINNIDNPFVLDIGKSIIIPNIKRYTL